MTNMNIHMQLVGLLILSVVVGDLAANSPDTNVGETKIAGVDDVLSEGVNHPETRVARGVGEDPAADGDGESVLVNGEIQTGGELPEAMEYIPFDRIAIRWFCSSPLDGVLQHGQLVRIGCNTCICLYGRLSCSKRPCPPCSSEAYMDLNSGTIFSDLSGLTLITSPATNLNDEYSRNKCSKMALLKVNFEKLSSGELDNSFGCLPVPYCVRRFLKIEMTLSSSLRAEHMFDLGDSETNDGHDGDGGTQTNDAELHAVYPAFSQYASDICKPAVTLLETFANVLAPPATRVTVWISNEYVRVQNNAGFDRRICNNCLWALNGQTDSEGPVNEDIFLSFNRVISARNRYGVGICNVKLSWDCPLCRWRYPTSGLLALSF